MAESTTTVYHNLQDKHPQGSDPSVPSNDTPALQVSAPQVLAAVNSFHSASGPGPSGERACHLQVVLKCPNSAAASRALQSTTSIVNHFLSGQVPHEFAAWIGGAKLFAIKKKSGGIRPIAAGDFTRRLVAKICCIQLKSLCNEIFQPLQFGVGNPRRCRSNHPLTQVSCKPRFGQRHTKTGLLQRL